MLSQTEALAISPNDIMTRDVTAGPLEIQPNKYGHLVRLSAAEMQEAKENPGAFVRAIAAETEIEQSPSYWPPVQPRVMHSSKRCDWGTPNTLFEPLHKEFGFLVDVAAEKANAKRYLYYGPDQELPEYQDGLAVDWFADCKDMHVRQPAVFMNPPYARGDKKLGLPAFPIEPWLAKAVLESSKGLTVVGIIPANVQTQWWDVYVRAAYEVRFLTHRVSFMPPTGITKSTNAGHNVAVVIWKPLVKLGYVKFFEPSYRYAEYR